MINKNTVAKIAKIMATIFLIPFIGIILFWAGQEVNYLRAERGVLEMDKYAVREGQAIEEIEDELDLLDEKLQAPDAGLNPDFHQDMARYVSLEKEFVERTEEYNRLVEDVERRLAELEDREYKLIPGTEITFSDDVFPLNLLNLELNIDNRF